MITVFDVEKAPVEDFLIRGVQLGRTGELTRESAQILRTVTSWDEGGSWSGSSSDAAAHHLQSPINRIDITGATASAAAAIAQGLSGVLVSLRTMVQLAMKSAHALGFLVRPDGTVVPSPALRLAAGPVAAAVDAMALALTVTLRGGVLGASSIDMAARGAFEALNSSNALATPPQLTSTVPAAGPITITRVESPRGPVVTIGDVEHADRVITVVSGVGSSSADGVKQSTAWAEKTVREALTRGENVAVVAWHGYPAPPTVPAGATPDVAIAAAPDLRAHQQSLRRINPTAHLEVVGYSYGSSVVGQAAQGDLEADSIELWGSPGTPPITDIPVRAHRVPGDLIRLAPDFLAGLPGISHGADPAPSSDWDRAMDMYLWFRGEWDSHSSYWHDPEVRG